MSASRTPPLTEREFARISRALVANAARIFNVSTIPTTVAEKTFSGPKFDEIKAAFPKAGFFGRISMNP
jgi:hypothetical protein